MKHNKQYQRYYKEREMEYRAILPKLFSQRHQVAKRDKEGHLDYCFAVVANIRAYGAIAREVMSYAEAFETYRVDKRQRLLAKWRGEQ
ncbi:hypothetical protein LS68_008030 [Helicobacter sp. MIT 05-5293]|uniref:hypothetical protein n=1 Tax=Helicobacter sp. MIT 05-5293 TaxID=1548149 RepID=UPI00051DBB30|nr:hypothetical protein [Helicobacter sp. MIT 05-5293]TLD80156.1 hypothetical protein LS68_008030 [Helicobacter sp. MIT 05-5293]